MRKALATATATVDRLLHHAHLCQTSGESVRLSQALTGELLTLTTSKATAYGKPPVPTTPPRASGHESTKVATRAS